MEASNTAIVDQNTGSATAMGSPTGSEENIPEPLTNHSSFTKYNKIQQQKSAIEDFKKKLLIKDSKRGRNTNMVEKAAPFCQSEDRNYIDFRTFTS